jgi:uncharacterized protein YjbI with pentapeptide repeats
MAPDESESLSEKFYENREFKSLQLRDVVLNDVEFYNCTFQGCQLLKARLPKCRFEKCMFERTDLSLVALPETSLVDVRFVGCKLIGVNWTVVASPFSVEWQRCDVSQSVLMDMNLQRIVLEDCVARDTDFAGANLAGARLCRTDFTKSRFLRTDLGHADFSGATNYFIDPTLNQLKKTIFSLPEAVSLLSAFDIILR